MTFGEDWGWGASQPEAQRIVDAYADRGGNFIDTANFYTYGSSERIVGAALEGKRDRFVLATKYTLSHALGESNASGNSRRSMIGSVESSLKRLRTDYIDLLYLHVWDATTPAEEVMRAFDDLVRAGKVLYVGISDTPAWQVARMQTLAELRGWSPFVALQVQYNLTERTVERELIPMAQGLGLGVIPWSPLASGVLTGKYTKADLQRKSGDQPTGTRLDVAFGNGSATPRAIEIADEVVRVAKELGTTPARVAIAWTLLNPAVTSPIIGARTLAQLEENLGALDIELSPEHRARLERASHVELGFPHEFVNSPLTRSVIAGGVKLEPRRA
jgi:aryl-alcohol dehydrogenase-like predicted oxidoreductase